MFLWRISNHADLIGLGGQKLSARWHTAMLGKRIVYLTEHPAVGLIESLANLRGNPRLFEKHLQLLKVITPDQMQARELSTDQLASIDPQDFIPSQTIGDTCSPTAPPPSSAFRPSPPQNPGTTSSTRSTRRCVADHRVGKMHHLRQAPVPSP